MSKTTVKGTSLWAWLLGAIFSAAGWVIVQVLKGLGWLGYRLLLWAVGHFRTTLGLGVLSGAVLLIGWKLVVGIVGVVLLSGSVWKAAHRESFDALIGTWLRTWHRKWWTYRRRWESVMDRLGLVVEHGDEREYPKLRKVATTPYWDRVLVEMRIGQEVADYEAVQGRLLRAFEGERIAVRPVDPKSVQIEVMRRDPFLYETVPAAAMPASTAEIDFSALPIGLTEFLDPLTVSVVGGHLAGAGASGSGKAGVAWNILRRLAPAIADGTVKPVFIDPKARELRQGIELVDAGTFNTQKPQEQLGRRRGAAAEEVDSGPQPSGDYAVTEWDTICLLERLAEEVHRANVDGGAAGERDFVPSQRTPLRLIVIDELAPLLAYWSRSGRDRIENALGIILTQGRAAGYIVLGLIQEPTKDIFTMRDLFARRLGLRLPTEAHTDAALADQAVERGAECHRIPESLPGVLFSFQEGEQKAVRGRLGNVRDQEIQELVEFVRALRSVPSIAPQTGPELPAIEYVDEADAGRLIHLDGDADDQAA